MWEKEGGLFIYFFLCVCVNHLRKVYCDRCCSSIWLGLQSSRHCRECGLSAHDACLEESALRSCVAEKVRSRPDFILSICPEKSLAR